MATHEDDIALAKMCEWLKANRMVAQVTLSGRLTLTPIEDAYPPELLEHKRYRKAKDGP